MSRRHTLTSPEQRRMPRDGRNRIAVRLKAADDLEQAHVLFSWMATGGQYVPMKATRRQRRDTAWSTRAHGRA